jgi:hypothetical protein
MLGSTSGRDPHRRGRPGRGATKGFGRGVVASALARTPLRRAERIGEVVAHGEKRERQI